MRGRAVGLHSSLRQLVASARRVASAAETVVLLPAVLESAGCYESAFTLYSAETPRARIRSCGDELLVLECMRGASASLVRRVLGRGLTAALA
jgi:hypothetical protein